MKQLLTILLCISLLFFSPDFIFAAEPEVSAPSVILMESSTGTILYEKNSHEVLRPASITKIMTLLLLFEALEKGEIALTDSVPVSAYAASMGGSQVYLEAGETQTVETMLKCISVASANDACVAMAEYVAGTEDEFVRRMNERAAALGMNDTTFVNCCGLDVDGHVTSAYDVALMSRALTNDHPAIYDYCTIWMDTITHTTARGTSEFGLTNTNKLIRQYEYATGLKTGSTSLAKYCVSATAQKNEVDLIAVVMAADDHIVRFTDATTLLNYGFSICEVYEDDAPPTLPTLPVRKGTADEVTLSYEDLFRYVSTDGSDLSAITCTIDLPGEVAAPVEAGDIAGYLTYELSGKQIGSVPILFQETIDTASFCDYMMKLSRLFFF